MKPLLAVATLVLAVSAAACTEKDLKNDADPAMANQLRGPELAPLQGQGSTPGNGVKPVAPVARGGIPDDSIKPVAPVARGGTADDGVKPVAPSPLKR
ncbi:MAG TPA: hypothetical protein VM580_22000 [Labilithrix sp.]|nr:hypothetical protein [Labilithrix sp.]